MLPPAQPARRDPNAERALIALCVSQGLLWATLGLARWASFHNQTFDLAFYSRMAWGMTHRDHWEPLVGADIHGLHLAPILMPLGAIGGLFGIAPVLIVAQALALALTAFPLAKIGERHLGSSGRLLAAIVWLLYPNLAHVAAYEAHPGTMAVLPFAWIALAIDSGSIAALALGSFWVLAFREDLTLVSALAAGLFAWYHRAKWRWALGCGLGSLAYALLFFAVLHPRYAPPQGSLQLHFGRFGQSPGQVLGYLLTHPGQLIAHLATRERLGYLPKLLAPLALLTLRRPAWLLPVLPLLAINLLSDWPTMLALDEHYATPIVPFLIAGALIGVGSFGARWRDITGIAMLCTTLIAHVWAGGTPMSLDFDRARFLRDEDTFAAQRIVAAIPPQASVQAPDPLLSHVAERTLVRRSPPPEAATDYIVLDAEVRRRFAANEDLLRTIEEPPLRDWMARSDHRLVAAGGRWLLLERGHSPRTGLGANAIVGRADPEQGRRIARCLAVLGADLQDDLLTLTLVARGPCDHDLAIRIGVDERPRRVDLLFAGWLSPAQLVRGDRLRSVHRLGEEERARIALRGSVRIGAMRSSGARPEHADPTAVDVPLVPPR